MKRMITCAAVALLITAVATQPHAAREAQTRVTGVDVNRIMHYSFADNPPPTDRSVPIPPQRLSGTNAPTLSPGLQVGTTWYDQQHNGRMGRMNETRTNTMTIAHFSWMHLPAPAHADRGIAYNLYNFSASLIDPFPIVTQPGDYAGYANLDVTNDNRAVIVGHNREATESRYDIQIYWDCGEGQGFEFCSFGHAIDQVPATLSSYAAYPDQSYVIWPTISYVEGPSDTVTHIFGQGARPNAGDPQPIYYFRRIGSDSDPTAYWDYPAYVVDTVHNIAQTVDGTDNGKVALVWIANVPCTDADPDTASCDDIGAASQWNNDLYYQISNDYGVTWQPRVNLTKSRLAQTADIPHFQPYTDLSILLDSQNDLHIVWGAAYWPTGSSLYAGGESALLHWSEATPYIRTVYDATWAPGNCNPGTWNLNVSKMSISECQSRIYVMFVMFNNRPEGILDDCASPNNPGYPVGAANGDLYVSISADNGLTWDSPRNLTNSHTPGCDSLGGVGGPCDNDHWPTMARYGDNHTAGPEAPVIVPAGGTDNGWYLDIQYINDHSAGSIMKQEGYWQPADVRWIRMACVEPVIEPILQMSTDSVKFIGLQCGDTTAAVTLSNLGNAELTYTVTLEEDPSPYSGWLTTTGFSGIMQSGMPHVPDPDYIHINAASVVCTPGAYAELHGRIILTGNSPTSPDTIHVDAYFSPYSWECWADTVSTTCISLLVEHDGSFGGDDDTRGVGMDYFGVDCDTTATTYLYDGSPVIGWINGADTIMNFSIYGDYTTPYGFYPTSCPATYSHPDTGEIYRATFLTHDSSIALEKTWYAPQQPDSCNFMIQKLRVWSNNGLAHSGLMIGEAVDWDIPADSLMSPNGSNFNVVIDMIYQYGGEYHQDDSVSCQDNDARFGALRYLAMYSVDTDTTPHDFAPWSAHTRDNESYVYGTAYGFEPAQLYQAMADPGWSKYFSGDADSLTDLHTTMTFLHGYHLDAAETLIVYTAFVTVQNGSVTTLTADAETAKQWAASHVLPYLSCCRLRGDFNDDGSVKVSDLTALINYLFRGGPGPACFEHGDTNGDGKIDIKDLSGVIIPFLFRGGPPPAPC